MHHKVVKYVKFLAKLIFRVISVETMLILALKWLSLSRLLTLDWPLRPNLELDESFDDRLAGKISLARVPIPLLFSLPPMELRLCTEQCVSTRLLQALRKVDKQRAARTAAQHTAPGAGGGDLRGLQRGGVVTVVGSRLG